mgnify:CR=1 FL=1
MAEIVVKRQIVIVGRKEHPPCLRVVGDDARELVLVVRVELDSLSPHVFAEELVFDVPDRIEGVVCFVVCLFNSVL